MTSVKVRIAVAVNWRGQWAADGIEVFDDWQAISRVTDRLGPNVTVHWVTAELPIPEPVEVAGSVEE